MPPAARVGDATSHGTPLGPGPGSPNVLIGGMPAWRGQPISMHVCSLQALHRMPEEWLCRAAPLF